MPAPTTGIVSRLRRCAAFIGGLAGWRRNLCAFLFGICSTLTLAPFFVFPLLIPSFTGLYWLLDGAQTKWRRFADGWWWGWGFYMAGLYWFCIALLTDAEKFAWLIPFALFALTGVIALYSGVACWLMSWARARGVGRLYVFSVVWTLVEVARGHLLSGFPWNLAGYSFGFSDPSLQLASLVGVYGLTWYAVLLGCSVAALLMEKRGILFAVFIWGLFAVGMCWGAWRLQEADKVPENERFVKGVLLRLVQANLSQSDKMSSKLEMGGLQEQVRLTQEPGLEKVTHVIWPESAVPYAMRPGTTLPHMLGRILPENTLLLAGTLRLEGDEDHWQIWNSLVALGHDGQIRGSYDKQHLVPFGEFQPLRDYVPKSWLTPVGDKDFSRGSAGQVMDVPGLPPFVPLICYEAIFPDLEQNAGKKPEWLLNITNDAWFGSSSGPYQHFHMARMRAVENGVPLVRAANTGISAVVDSYGRILNSISLEVQGFDDVRLPTALAGDTGYRMGGHWWLPLLTFMAIIVNFQRRKKHGFS